MLALTFILYLLGAWALLMILKHILADEPDDLPGEVLFALLWPLWAAYLLLLALLAIPRALAERATRRGEDA